MTPHLLLEFGSGKKLLLPESAAPPTKATRSVNCTPRFVRPDLPALSPTPSLPGPISLFWAPVRLEPIYGLEPRLNLAGSGDHAQALPLMRENAAWEFNQGFVAAFHGWSGAAISGIKQSTAMSPGGQSTSHHGLRIHFYFELTNSPTACANFSGSSTNGMCPLRSNTKYRDPMIA
jgi:hypothetical protein